jgi:hypothetical protein
MRRLVLVAAAGFVGGWVAAHIYDRSLGAGDVDVPTEFRYVPQVELRVVGGDPDAVHAAMRRHPAGKRLAQ